MTAPAVARTAALLVGGTVAAGLAVAATAFCPAVDRAPTPPAQVFAAPSDRDVLRAAAGGTPVSVQRDAAGVLVMVLPGAYDGRTVEQVVAPPPSFPAGSPALLGGAAVLMVAGAGLRVRGRRTGRLFAAAGTGAAGTTGVVQLLAGTVPAVLGGAAGWLALGCTALGWAALASVRVGGFVPGR